jgi:hypothetical protein
MPPPRTAAAPGFYRASGLVRRPVAVHCSCSKLTFGGGEAAVHVRRASAQDAISLTLAKHPRPGQPKSRDGVQPGYLRVGSVASSRATRMCAAR